MKKLFTLALLAILGMSSAVAEEVTMKYTGTETSNMVADGSNEAATFGLDASSWSVTADKGAASNAPGLNKAGDLRLYYNAGGSNTVTVSSLDNKTINSIAITFTGNNYSNVSVSVDGNAVTGTDGKFDINSTSFVLGNGNTSNAQVRISQIVITYGNSSTPVSDVATPKFSVAPGKYSEPQTVALTCETEGAKILYTIPDGSTDPAYIDDENYTGVFYNGEPLVISRTTTIKAMAVKDGKTSNIATATYTIEEEQETQVISVANALEIIAGLEDGAKTTDTYQVKGYVVQMVEIGTGYGNATFVIADDKTATEGLTVFRIKGFDGANITNANYLAVGDEVVVEGLLQKYVKEGVTTPEVAQGGKIISINGKTEDDGPNPEDVITKGLTADAPMTVDEALAYIDGFENGFITSKQYYVQGDVAEVKEISNTNGNATFTMAGTNGTLTIYRVKGLENKNIADEGYLREQDQVVVLAKLQKYVKGEVVTPEMSSGYIYMLNGETKDDTPEPQPVDFEGDGSKENPYTVADLKKMNSATYPAEAAWVKGVIVGAAKSGTSLETEKDVVSNIAIAATTDATEFVPVELKYNTDFRAKLNIVDNPTLIGKEVKLCGTIMAYFSVTGMKNLTDYELEGGESIQGDANGDGVVDVADVDFVIEAIGGEYAQAADVNGDGAVDVADVDFIIEQIQ